MIIKCDVCRTQCSEVSVLSARLSVHLTQKYKLKFNEGLTRWEKSNGRCGQTSKLSSPVSVCEFYCVCSLLALVIYQHQRCKTYTTSFFVFLTHNTDEMEFQSSPFSLLRNLKFYIKNTALLLLIILVFSICSSTILNES